MRKTHDINLYTGLHTQQAFQFLYQAVISTSGKSDFTPTCFPVCALLYQQFWERRPGLLEAGLGTPCLH